MDLIASELPQMLGYIALVAVLLIGIGVIELADRARSARRHRQETDARQLERARTRREGRP